MSVLKDEPIHSKDELEFAVFCIENVAIRLGVSAEKVYHAFTETSNTLNGYIIPCYEVLHSQSKEYIVDDLIAYMKKRGIQISQLLTNTFISKEVNDYECRTPDSSDEICRYYRTVRNAGSYFSG